MGCVATLFLMWNVMSRHPYLIAATSVGNVNLRSGGLTEFASFTRPKASWFVAHTRKRSLELGCCAEAAPLPEKIGSALRG